jgi:asparagine synthase (glutamine-hydrolysing)
VYEDADILAFASELKALTALPRADLSLNPAGFQDYLTFRYMQAPFTLFKRIRRLDPGTFLQIRGGTAAQYRYWDISYADTYPPRPEEELREELASLLKNAVQSQLMGEVPIGVLLSGGLDSSSIAYFVHRLGAQLTTYNIGFPEVNEFEFSRAIANMYDLRHVEVTTTSEELIADLDAIVLALDEPIADPACFPLYQLCKELKRSVTVVLSGEGGDELFAGYPQYVQTAAGGEGQPGVFEQFLNRSYYFLDHQHFLHDQHLPPHHLRFGKYFAENPLLNGMLAYDMKTWMPENLMMKADKILMAHSLEGRFPFLDKNLFEFSARLPQQYKLGPDGKTKALLKDMMAPCLPELIIKRPKMGFSVPVAGLLAACQDKVMASLEALCRTDAREILQTEAIRQLFENYYRENLGSALQVWTMFILCHWYTFALASQRTH